MKKLPNDLAIVAFTTLCLLVLLPQGVHGGTMTFDSAPTRTLWGIRGISTDPSYQPPYEYIEDGIKLSLVSNHYDMRGGPDGHVNIDTGTAPEGAIRFDMVDGSLFDLNSLNVRTFPPNPSFPGAGPLEYKLSFSDGSHLTIDPGNTGVDALLLLNVTNLSYFTYSIRQTAPFDQQHNTWLDNINMTPASVSVPEAGSTLLLLGIGLVGLRLSQKRWQ